MKTILEQFESLKVIPVVKIQNVEHAVPLAKALIDGGLPVAEVTFRTACAGEAIKQMKEAYPEILVGAGTILTIAQVEEAMESGAEFIVSPGFNEKVVGYCVENNIPIFPGCSHASDIERAIEKGLEVVKFFPAKELGGLATIKALAAPYHQVRFMPTGGITEDTIGDYLAFDKIIACGGSWMVKEDLILGEKFDEIAELTAGAVRRVNGEAEVACTEEDTYVVSKNDGTQPAGHKVASFGEILLRLSTEGYTRFNQANGFNVNYGGAEANVAVALTNYGMDSKFITQVPAHDIGQSAINELRKYGVDTSDISKDGNRLGIYFLEKGASQRPSKVIYDRADSAITKITTETFDWDEILKDVGHFFITGITPALGKNVAEVCLQACKKCKEKNIMVWCDLNYREKLWSKEEARKVLQQLMKYVDVCITNEHHACDMLEIPTVEIENREERHHKIAEAMVEKFGFAKVALTIRTSLSASDNILSAMLYEGGESYFAKAYNMHIVDRIGGGDAFAGGLIYAQAHNYSPQESIEFGTAAECLKHTIEGDFNQVTTAEVLTLATGDGKGLVQR